MQLSFSAEALVDFKFSNGYNYGKMEKTGLSLSLNTLPVFLLTSFLLSVAFVCASIR